MQKYVPDSFLNKIGDTYLIVNHDLSMMSVQIIDYYLFRFFFVFFIYLLYQSTVNFVEPLKSRYSRVFVTELNALKRFLDQTSRSFTGIIFVYCPTAQSRIQKTRE